MNPDSSDISSIEQRMKNATLELHRLAPLVGAAKQVRDYDSDRRKIALAVAMRPHIKSGDSGVQAETLARSDERFSIKIDELARQRGSAEATIAKWDATFASFEAARSLLSMAKENLKTLE